MLPQLHGICRQIRFILRHGMTQFGANTLTVTQRLRALRGARIGISSTKLAMPRWARDWSAYLRWGRELRAMSTRLWRSRSDVKLPAHMMTIVAFSWMRT